MTHLLNVIHDTSPSCPHYSYRSYVRQYLDFSGTALLCVDIPTNSPGDLQLVAGVIANSVRGAAPLQAFRRVNVT